MGEALSAKSQYVVDQVANRLVQMMRSAVLRANYGIEPRSDEMAARSQVEEDADTGIVLVRWDGDVILSIRPCHNGMAYEYQGAAAMPLPGLIGG